MFYLQIYAMIRLQADRQALKDIGTQYNNWVTQVILSKHFFYTFTQKTVNIHCFEFEFAVFTLFWVSFVCIREGHKEEVLHWKNSTLT